MANNNGFVYFDEAVVKRTNACYKVVFEEEVTIFKKASLVDDIASKTGEDENLIAVLLAQIEYVRRSNAEFGERRPRNIDNENIIRGVAILLKSISIEQLISKVKSSNWHELVYIFESEYPNMEL